MPHLYVPPSPYFARKPSRRRRPSKPTPGLFDHLEAVECHPEGMLNDAAFSSLATHIADRTNTTAGTHKSHSSSMSHQQSELEDNRIAAAVLAERRRCAAIATAIAIADPALLWVSAESAWLRCGQKIALALLSPACEQSADSATGPSDPDPDPRTVAVTVAAHG